MAGSPGESGSKGANVPISSTPHTYIDWTALADTTVDGDFADGSYT